MVHTPVVLISASHDQLCKGGSRAVSPHLIYSPFASPKTHRDQFRFFPKNVCCRNKYPLPVPVLF